MTSGFSIIPVLDLKGGAVVHARAGDRANYRPIETPLAATSAPTEVLAGLLALAPFRAAYIADLDAIEGRGDHLAVVLALKARFPAVEFWLDSGTSDVAAARALSADGIVPVIGSESLADPAMPAQLGAALGPAAYVLSLDHRGAAFLGPPEIAPAPDAWPD